MAAVSGVNRKVALVAHTVIDTITAAGAGSLLMNDGLTDSKNQTSLVSTPIGSGNIMLKDADVGDYSPAADFTIDAKPGGGLPLIFGAFCQSELAPATQGGGIYAHSFIPQLSSITGYLALVKQEDGTNIKEYYNGKVNSLSLVANPNDFLKLSASLVFGERRKTGDAAVINSVATMANVTELSSNSPFVTRSAHKFRVNAQAGGALADGDLVAVTEVSVDYQSPHEIVPEIKGASGNGAPSRTGELGFTVTVTFKDADTASFVYVTALDAGTEYKADLEITTSTNVLFLKFPRLKVIADPDTPLNSTGRNPATVVFTAMQAASAPTGMGTTVPYQVIHNSISTKTWVG